MKNLSLFAASLLTALAILPSCKKDSDEPANLSDKTYQGLNDLEVNYNGSSMSGKKVAMTVNGKEATLTAEGVFDVASLSDDLKNVPALSAPGVLPGTPKLTIKTSLKSDGDKYSFSGSGNTDYVTYKYTGNVSDSHLTLNLSDVKLKDQRLAGGVWKPADADSDTGTFHIVWDTDPLPIPIPGFSQDLGVLLEMLTKMPVVEVEYFGTTAEMSLAQIFSQVIKTFAFNADGNMVITYVNSATGQAEITQAPLSMCQYIPVNDSQLKLFTNPTDLLSLVLLNTDKQSPNIPANPFGKTSRQTMSKWQMTLAMGMMQLCTDNMNGIMTQCPHTASEMQLYFGTDVMLPILKNMIVPVLTDAEFQQMVLAVIQSDPATAEYADMAKLIFESGMIQQLADKTTKIEFGLNLLK